MTRLWARSGQEGETTLCAYMLVGRVYRPVDFGSETSQLSRRKYLRLPGERPRDRMWAVRTGRGRDGGTGDDG